MTMSRGVNSVKARVNDIIDRAKAETGLSDFGGDSWREGLEVLVRSAETEATFNDFGEQSFYASLVRPLVNRLKIEDWYTRHPEIDEQEVDIELLGVGFPRTGSTALSHMLSEDPAFRILRIWEEQSPCPPPGMSAEEDDARLLSARAAVETGHSHMAARLRSMLPQSDNGPMEDHDMMALEFKAQFFLVSAHIPSYAAWFEACDMEPTYRYEKRVLKLLQWKTPEKRWRLKSPTHTLFLDAYDKVFPEARFVQTHRDVSHVLPSVSDLYFTMLQAGNPGTDPLYVGELNMHQWGLALDRCLAFRDDPARDARFYDIGFAVFQADPVGEIRKLYDWLGDELAASTVDAMLAWRGDNPKDKFGKHEYNAAEFGITDGALEERFGAYRRRFAPYLG
ncbi:MAG: sulfotransferase [Acidimicrobiaceae bacterium]|nr:sulfotransferase [Acidimicrobiaceae bacterium]